MSDEYKEFEDCYTAHEVDIERQLNWGTMTRQDVARFFWDSGARWQAAKGGGEKNAFFTGYEDACTMHNVWSQGGSDE